MAQEVETFGVTSVSAFRSDNGTLYADEKTCVEEEIKRLGKAIQANYSADIGAGLIAYSHSLQTLLARYKALTELQAPVEHS